MTLRFAHASLACLLSCVAVTTGCGGEGSGNRPPVAHAGDDSAAWTGEALTLDGGASFDPDADPLTFRWLVDGVEIGASASVAFTPPAAGTYLATLVVGDGVAEVEDVLVVTARDPLTIVASSPADGGTAFDRQPVVVVFSGPIRPWTAAAVTVEDVTDPAVPLPVLGSLTLDDGNTSVVFSPADPWSAAADYRLTVGSGVLSLDGAPVRTPLTVTFAGELADATPPRVLAVSPSNGAAGAPVSSFVDVIFSEPVDGATLALSLTPAGGGALPATVSLSAGGLRAILVATSGAGVPAALAADTDHAIAVAGTILDANGNALDGDGDGSGGDAFAASFRTAAGSDATPPRVLSVSPLAGAQGVSVKLPVTVTFSEPVDPASIDATTLVVTSAGGTAPVAGTISFALGNTVAILEPDANLRTASRYDVLAAASIRDLAQNALGADFRSFWITGAAPPPAVDSVTPSTVPVSSTVTVEITGEDFVDGASVAVLGGGVLVGSTTWLGPDLLRAELTLAPTAGLGSRALRVINPDGQHGTGLNVFTVTTRPPAIANVAPSSGQRATTANVVITGADFRNVPGNPTVSFGAGVTVNSVTYDSSTQLTANVTIAAGAAPGARDVTVTNLDDAQSAVAAGAFAVLLPAPAITSLGTTQARRKDILSVVVNGTGFQDMPPPVVSFGSGIGVSQVTFVSATRIDVDIAIGATAIRGARTVTVTNKDGQSGMAANAFTVLRAIPTVLNVNGASAPRQTTAAVTITGADFDCSMAPGTVPSVAFSGAGMTVANVSCGASTSDLATTLTANVTSSAATPLGMKNVTVTNSGDTGGVGLNLFTVDAEAPVLTSATPNPKQGETRTVNVFGNFFQATPGVSLPAGFTVNSVTWQSATQVSVNLSVALTVAKGTYMLTLTNPDGQSASANILTVDSAPPPAVTSVVPDFGEQGATNLAVTIAGDFFQPGGGTTMVSFGTGVTVTTANVLSTTEISATLSIAAAATIGNRNVTVTNPVGDVPMATLTNGFRVTGPAPTITTISVTSAPQGQAVAGIAINGTNFRAGASVAFGAGITVSGVVVTSNQITCDLAIGAGSTVGFRDVTVTNTDASAATLPNAFNVTPSGGGPGIAQVVLKSPLLQGKTSRMKIIGSNFNASATVSLSGTGITITNLTFRSSTQIDADLTPACGETVVLGPRDVSVTNPGAVTGTLTNAVVLRNGIVLNEVITDPQTGTGKDVVEIFNGSGCTTNLNGWVLDILDTDYVGYALGSQTPSGVTESFTGGSNVGSFLANTYLTIDDVAKGSPADGQMQDAVYLSLSSNTGRLIDELEIGDDEENDGLNDGAPAPGMSGAAQNVQDEAILRCPNGGDTENDGFDFFMDETNPGAAKATRTLGATNGPQCPVCSDGVDNDGDGWIDLLDRGCSGPLDDNEADGGAATQCSDGVDNGDPDALADENDPECFDSADNDESA